MSNEEKDKKERKIFTDEQNDPIVIGEGNRDVDDPVIPSREDQETTNVPQKRE